MGAKRMVATIRHDPCMAEKAGVRSISGSLDDPAPVAVVVERRGVSVELVVARGSIEGAAHVVHHLGVGVHRCKWGSIVVVPVSKDQPIGCQPHDR